MSNPVIYSLGDNHFMHVTPSVKMMNSKMLSSIVNNDDKQLVVNLETGLLTVHNKPKAKAIQESIAFNFFDVYIKLSGDVEKDLKRIQNIWTHESCDGRLLVKNRPELTVQAVGVWVNFERAVRRVYKELSK